MAQKKSPGSGPKRTVGKALTPLAALVVAVLLLLGQQLGILPMQEADVPPTPTSVVSAQDVDSPREAAPITDAQGIADYLFANGHLPPNFITKAEAKDLGWDSGKNDVSDVAPGMSIGGDRFGNYEGRLPDAPGRTWKEADCDYHGGSRGAKRVVFSNDGLVYYTEDHYQTFTQLFPSGG